MPSLQFGHRPLHDQRARLGEEPRLVQAAQPKRSPERRLIDIEAKLDLVLQRLQQPGPQQA